MGFKMSKIYQQNAVNYDCPKCKETGKDPTIAGRFHLINETECQCNGCKTIYPKSQFYKPVVMDAQKIAEH